MRRTTLLRGSVALALVPLMSACSLPVTFGGNTDSEGATATAPPATSEQPTQTAPPSEEPAPPQNSTEASGPGQDQQETAAATPPAGAPSAAATSDTRPPATSGERIEVPAGSGIHSMELIKLSGSDTSSGDFGKAVGVFKVTTDRPLMINLRVRLFDVDGEEIARNDGLNSSYTVGTHYLVTSNLVSLPAKKRPASFKVSLIDVTDMKDPTFTEFSQPKLSTEGDVPTLTGTFAFAGDMRSTHDANGACVMPDGKVFSGTEGLTDNKITTSGGTNTGTYKIPLYDARNMDLSKATCYASV